MKNHLIILSSAFAMLLIALTGCKVTDNTGVFRIHKYVNQSGVEVAMVGDAYGDIPDSLVIPNGETYECSLRYPGMESGYYGSIFPYKIGDPYEDSGYLPLKIYYNKDICVSYTYPDKGKNPLNQGSEERDETSKLITRTLTYIFTAEDYQKALKGEK